MLSRTKLSVSFLAYSLGIMSLLIILSTWLLTSRMYEQMHQSNVREIELMRESLRKKGEIQAAFLGRISFQPVVTEDFFSLNAFADQLFHDPEAVWFSIKSKDGKDVFSKLSNVSIDTTSLTLFSHPIAFGPAPAVANVTIGLSDSSIVTMQSEKERQLAVSLKQMVLYIGLFALGLNIMIAIALSLTLRRVVLRPLGEVSARLRDMSQGEGDLTRRIHLASEDEMGQMSKLFDGFLDKLQGVVRKVAEQTESLAGSAQGLSEGSSRMVSDAERMAKDAEEGSASAENTAGRMRDLSVNVEGIVHSVSNINSALAQINTSLTEVSRSCQKESDISDLANRKAQETKSLVRRLDKAAEGIGAVLHVIKDIADRTNLLALNASIEAASAGEAGRGFAVVAGEVKQLARQTAEATEEIGKTIAQIRTNTAESVAAIEEIAGVIEEVSNISSTIASAVEEQSAMVGEVAGNLASVDGASQAMGKSLQIASGGVAEVSGRFSSVARLAEGTVEVSKDAQESVRQLDALSGRLREIVGSFKI